MRQLLFKELLLLVVIVMLLLLLYSVLQLLRLMAVMLLLLLLLLLNPTSVGLLEVFASTHVLTFEDAGVVEVVIEV